MPHIIVNNCRIYYEVDGNGNKDIIFVHGNTASLLWWNKIRPFLPDKEFRYYFIDLRGAGRSENLPPYKLQQFADDIISFVESVGIRIPFYYVGHSMGGGVGYLVVLKVPEYIKSMTFVTPIPANGWFSALPSTIEFFKKMMQDHSLLAEMLRTKVMPLLNDEEFFKIILRDTIRTIPHYFTDTVYDMGKLNVIKLLEKVEVPALFCIGKKDIVVPYNTISDTISAWRNKEVVYFDCGHAPMVELPEKFVETFITFFKKT